MASELRAQYLQAMGIEAWQLRTSADVMSGVGQAPAMPDAPATGASTPMGNDWATLQQQVVTCVRCDLHRTRSQTVFGAGPREADWLVVGDAPTAEEDRCGEPMVGSAGQLLDAMFAAISLNRNRIYVTNMIKCRPPADRPAQANEVACCEAHLLQQIALIQPRLILAVGLVAAQYLLKTNAQLTQLRGQVHRFGGAQTPLIVTQHPLALLQSPIDKRSAWEDLRFAMSVYQGLVQGAEK